MLSNGSGWYYDWDAENRMKVARNYSTTPITGSQKVENTYDFAGRRTAKKVSSYSGTAWTVSSDIRFVYDGWNLIAELNAASSYAVMRTYVFGLDLSGSRQGAGGVGGLIAFRDATVSKTYSPFSDGNGNVMGWVNNANGVVEASFDYDPFGNVTSSTGVAATASPFRFSTKYSEAETGLLYYGFRYYNLGMGRWLSRDPIEEGDGPNMYAFIGNAPVAQYDVLGLYQPDGHFYATYIVAVLNGMSKSEAYRLAYYAQYADQDQRYDAIPAGKNLMGLYLNAPQPSVPYYALAERGWMEQIAYYRNVQEMLHSLHGGGYSDILKRRQCLVALLQNKSLKDWERGFVVHALGDAFSHTRGLTGTGKAFEAPLGHLFEGTTPDVPWRRPKVFRQYLGALNRGLGGGMTPSQLDIMTKLMTQKVQSDSVRLALARELAQRLGYSEAYDPSIDEALDPSMPKIETSDVKALFEKMRAACCSANSTK